MNAASFARQAGYTGSSPALLGAYEAIRQAGIREARKAHFDRKRIIDEMKAEPGMFFNAIRPSLSTAEAIEDVRQYLVDYRNMPTWRQEMRSGELRRAKQKMLQARFFRLHGKRIWIREAA